MPGSETQKEKPEKVECLDWAWKCNRCSALLGYASMPRLDQIRLKYKDSYVWIGEPAWVKVVCRGCGAMNDICDKEKMKTSLGATEESAPCASA